MLKKRLETTVPILAFVVLGIAVAGSDSGSAAGSPVSDAVAAELRGGCPGWDDADCEEVDICSNNGYISAGLYNRDEGPSGAGTTYCVKTENGEQVCNDSSQSYSSCGSGP